MTVDAQTLVFFDASCLIAAAGSPIGGSGFLFSLCGRYLLRGAVSPPVLDEAERNVRNKLGADSLERYHRIVVATPLLLTDVPPRRELIRFEAVVGAKDAHVLAAALGIQARYLVTLDQKLAERSNQANLGVQAFSPGGFITRVLPHHANYPSLRD